MFSILVKKNKHDSMRNKNNPPDTIPAGFLLPFCYMNKMTQLTIRKALIHDIALLHPVIERAYRGESAKSGWTHEADLLSDTRTDLATLYAILADDDTRLLVAKSGDAIIGCVQLSRRNHSGCYLGLLCVDPDLQAGGCGKTILLAAEQFARSEFDANHIIMTVIDQRTELIAYYERRGYHNTGTSCDFPITVDPPLFMTILRKAI
jgi:GNAT superfamily N-acetyltransferase